MVSLRNLHMPIRAVHMHYLCIIAYLYCEYVLVGGAISIRDPHVYLCRLRVCANESHVVFHRPVVCAVKNVAIGFKTSIEAYFVEEKKHWDT